MGLGKTLQALAAAEFVRTPRGAVLVLCTPTLRAAWARAVAAWLRLPACVVRAARDLRPLRRRAPRDDWDDAPPPPFVVAAYDSLPRLRLDVALRFDVVVADECHVLRNVATARTAAALPLLLAAEHRILVSGTPALSRPADLYPLLRAILETPATPFLTHAQFVARYCPCAPPVAPAPTALAAAQAAAEAAAEAAAHEEELCAVLAAVMIRRTKSAVLSDLPPKTRRHVLLPVSAPALSDITRLRADADALLARARHVSPSEAAAMRARREALISKLYLRTADAKIPGVLTRVRHLLREQPTRKILVFAHHLHVLDSVEALATRERVTCVRIDGAVAPPRRDELVHEFQRAPSVRLAVLSLSVAGTGLTLTAADTVLFAELCWVPTVLLQAEDRAHRIGRTDEVIVEYVVAPRTLDDMMLTTLRGKIDIVARTVDGHRKRKGQFHVSEAKRIHVAQHEIQAVVSDAILGEEGDQEHRDGGVELHVGN